MNLAVQFVLAKLAVLHPVAQFLLRDVVQTSAGPFIRIVGTIDPSVAALLLEIATHVVRATPFPLRVAIGILYNGRLVVRREPTNEITYTSEVLRST